MHAPIPVRIEHPLVPDFSPIAKLMAASTAPLSPQQAWVNQAKAQGLREPTGPIDPFRSTPAEIENAFQWWTKGGVIPRDELARDGGQAFIASIRDAAVLRTQGFEALLDLYAGHPTEQRALLVRELATRGLAVAPEEAEARYAQLRRDETSRQPTIGLDGRVGTAEAVDAYERHEAFDAMNPGTTLGSIMATSTVLATGQVDVDRMRAMGNAGNAAEGMAGGAGVHLNAVAAEREPLGKLKTETDDFNRSGLEPRFKKLKPMNPYYAGEHLPGNAVWNSDHPSKPFEVQYVTRPVERAELKLEARSIVVNGRNEVRLFDAKGQLFDTRDATAHDGSARAIFVMNAHGEIYASTFQEARYLHHSTLSGGQPVAAAGELVVEQGKVVAISNRSGHYRPDAAHTEQLLTSLRSSGVDLSGVIVETHREPKKGDDPFAGPDTRVLR